MNFCLLLTRLQNLVFRLDLVLRNANLSRSALHGLFWIDNVFFSSIFGIKTSFAEMLLQS